MSEKIKVVYIAGLGRSGSTLLDLIISTNSRVFSVGEIYHFNDIMKRNAPCACGQNVANCDFWKYFEKQKNKIIINNLATPGNYLKILSHLYNPFSSRQKPFQKNEDNYRLFNGIRSKFFSSNGDYILDSSKDVSRLIELSQDDRFDIYCIHIVRDGRGTANSYASKRAATSQNFYVVLFKWIIANLFTERFIKKSGIKNIRINLNLLCQNPKKYITKIENFLRIKIPENYVGVIRLMDYHNIGGNKISKVKNRGSFTGIKCVERWKDEENFINRFMGTIITYFFNKRWMKEENCKNKKYNWLIKINFISLAFVFLLNLILSGENILARNLLSLLFSVFGFSVFALGGINLAVIFESFKSRKFDGWVILAIGASLSLFLIPALNAVAYVLIGKINFLTIFSLYAFIFFLLFITLKTKDND